MLPPSLPPESQTENSATLSTIHADTPPRGGWLAVKEIRTRVQLPKVDAPGVRFDQALQGDRLAHLGNDLWFRDLYDRPD